MVEIGNHAVKAFGIDNQLQVLAEECCELAVAISHYRRGRETGAIELAEEYSDVFILMTGILIWLDESGMAETVDKIIEFKLKRLKKRIEEQMG